MTNDKFFQIPLCAFAFGSSDRQCLDWIISFALVDTGLKQWDRLPKIEREQFLMQLEYGEKTPNDHNESIELHNCAMLGARALNVTIGSVVNTVGSYKSLLLSKNEYEKRNGRDVLVRLK